MGIKLNKHIMQSRLNFISLFSVLLVFLVSCSNDQSMGVPFSGTKVVVDVIGVTPDIQTLRAILTINGKKSQQIPDFLASVGEITKLGFQIPPELSTGMLSIILSAVPDYRFVIAQGQVVVMMNAEPSIATSITLTRNQVCSNSGWCWDSPLPMGRRINAFWSNGPADLWAVADFGTILHYDGSFWSLSPSPIEDNLYSISGSGPNDVWAAGGNNSILHWDGSSWLNVPSPIVSLAQGVSMGFTGVVSVGSNMAWFVGNEYTYTDSSGIIHVLYYDGTGWVQYNQAQIGLSKNVLSSKIKMDGSTLYVIGQNQYGTSSYFVKFSNQTWTDLTSSIATCNTNLSGVVDLEIPTPGSLWVVCGAVVLRGSEASLQLLAAQPPQAMGAWSDLLVASSTEAWLVGNPRDGSGVGTAVMKWNGAAATPYWSSVPNQALPKNVVLGVLHKDQGGNIWVGGIFGIIRQYNNNSWTDHLPQNIASVGVNYVSVSGSGPNDVWAAGYDNTPNGFISHYDGMIWSNSLSIPGKYIGAVLANSSKDVWIAGIHGYLSHYNGSTWLNMPASSVQDFDALWGSDSSHVWVGGTAGTIMRWDGSQWNLESTPSGDSTKNVISIYGVDGNNIWAVGGDESASPKTLFLKYDSINKKWLDLQAELDPLPNSITNRPPVSVWASDPNNIWIGSRQGPPSTNCFNNTCYTPSWCQGAVIWGTGVNDVWCFQRFDFMAHGGGVGSSSASSNGSTGNGAQIRIGGLAGDNVNAAWGLPSGDIWIVSTGGTILHRKAQ